MERTGICRLCGTKINYNVNNIKALGEHLLKTHPEVEITHFTPEDFGSNFSQQEAKTKSKSRCSSRVIECGKDFECKQKISKTITTASSMFKKKLSKTSKSKDVNTKFYKTTVETWQPGTAALPCPKCGANEQPYIRRQRNKVAYNSLGAYFLLGCWPLCFCPMVMFGGTTTTICCRECGYCFGTYDKKKGKLVPPDKEIIIETPNVC